ncbi:MAG: hypothetical protein K0R18_348 [Bacillales bacterium]|jgi:hypothetical protein|nr:hypothetical protein [Bacillales bacterium]
MKMIVKLFTVLAFGAVVSLATINLTKAPESIPASVTTTINKVNEIQMATVIEKLSTKAEIVGLNVPFSKESSYYDSNFFGGRTFKFTLHGNVKMGFDINEVIKGISIKGNTIQIITPQPMLISFEAPFDKAVIEKPDVDLLRQNFNKDDFQLFYKSTADKAREEILASSYISTEAKNRTQGILRDLLMTVSNVENVEFLSL